MNQNIKVYIGEESHNFRYDLVWVPSYDRTVSPEKVEVTILVRFLHIKELRSFFTRFKVY